MIDLSKNYILKIRRFYKTKYDGANQRILDIRSYKESLDRSNDITLLELYNDPMNLTWSKKELDELLSNKHVLSSNTLTWETSIEMSLKVLSIYDSTLTALPYKVLNPHIKPKIGDSVEIK